MRFTPPQTPEEICYSPKCRTDHSRELCFAFIIRSLDFTHSVCTTKVSLHASETQTAKKYALIRIYQVMRKGQTEWSVGRRSNRGCLDSLLQNPLYTYSWLDSVPLCNRRGKKESLLLPFC